MKIQNIDLDIVADFPNISCQAAKALEILNESPVDFDKLEKTLKLDVNLATRILKIANSPFYGLSRKILSLKDAFVVLGVYTVRNLVTTAAVADIIIPNDSSPINIDELWQHCIVVSCAAKIIAREIKYSDAEACCMAGLLHEVGRMALNCHKSEQYSRVIEIAASDNISLLQAEKQELGFTHNELGALLINKWNLPSFLEECLQNYHSPSSSSDPICLIVHLANYLAYQYKIGSTGEVNAPKLSEVTLTSLEISCEQLEELKQPIISMSKEAMAIMD